MDLLVTADGWLSAEGPRYRCAIGRSGITPAKAEGDGATPEGAFPFRRFFYRADRLKPPQSNLPGRALRPDDGWCDDPADESYNRLVRLPYRARTEALYRDDSLYDIVVVIGHNDAPVEANRGSAIFLHVAAPDYAPTDGCVALALPDLLHVLARLDLQSRIVIRKSG